MIIKLLLVEFNSFVPSTIVFFHDRKYLSTADEHSFTLYQDNLYIVFISLNKLWKVYMTTSSWRPAPTRRELVHSAKIIKLGSVLRVPVVFT